MITFEELVQFKYDLFESESVIKLAFLLC